MTRNEQQMYSDITSIRKSLEKIANALDNNVPKDEYETDGTSVGNGKYEDEYTYEPNSNRDKGEPALIEYLDGIKNDSDYDVRVDANYYGKFLSKFYNNDNLSTKKDCILEYVTKAFRNKGARYTDIIKFAYYLGAPNAPKYDATRDRGYYSCAFSYRMNGHLIQGGRDFLVKGINKNGKERYFAYNSVNKYTDYYKRIQ